VQCQVYFGQLKNGGGVTGAGVTELGAAGSSRFGLLGSLMCVGAAGGVGATAAADVVAVVVGVFVVVLGGLLLALLPHAVSPPIAMIATAPV
jgi:hypothetical protein